MDEHEVATHALVGSGLAMPPSVPDGMRLELRRVRLRPDALDQADRWMAMLHERHDEGVATLDGERVAFEAWFRHTDADGTDWLYTVVLYGEGGVADLSTPVDQAHVAYALRCELGEREKLRPVMMLAPAPVRAVMEAWGREGSASSAP